MLVAGYVRPVEGGVGGARRTHRCSEYGGAGQCGQGTHNTHGSSENNDAGGGPHHIRPIISKRRKCA
ncbi:MAG: hypothetical protein NVSMB55_03000 [Mycobacteriales bacterium]